MQCAYLGIAHRFYLVHGHVVVHALYCLVYDSMPHGKHRFACIAMLYPPYELLCPLQHSLHSFYIIGPYGVFQIGNISARE